MPITLQSLNESGHDTFMAICGPVFEHSAWIADRTWPARPFGSIDQLHAAMCEIVHAAPVESQLQLIQAHPDLVGRLAREGRLTAQSTIEQTVAGLTGLNWEEASQFDRCNAEYKDRFGFPFVICARENKKDAILAAFSARLQNDRDTEIATALTEIFKIARLRLTDAVTESIR
jgi:2-oxo-4-hydroxy-4-carboxy-5-ureidoimidazoline decarboxylase